MFTNYEKYDCNQISLITKISILAYFAVPLKEIHGNWKLTSCWVIEGFMEFKGDTFNKVANIVCTSNDI